MVSVEQITGRHVFNQIPPQAPPEGDHTLTHINRDTKNWVDWETVNTEVGVGGKWVNKHTEEEGTVRFSWVKPDSPAWLKPFTGCAKWGWEG